MKKNNNIVIFILLSVAIFIFVVTLFVALKHESKRKSKYGNAVSYITNLYNIDAESNNLKKDNTVDANIRYYGANPNNYVKFNNELWRIIGVFGNNVKLIRNENLGYLSWDSSDYTVNKGYGVNEWSQADLKDYLNTMYYGGTTVTCYNGANNTTTTCPSVSLNENAKGMINNHTWATGAVSIIASIYEVDANAVYNAERAAKSGCLHCSDTVTRTTSWTGYIALPYITDWAYASSETDCEREVIIIGSNESVCKNNNWMNRSGYTWYLSPYVIKGYTFGQDLFDANEAWYVDGNGRDDITHVSDSYGVAPALYLKSDIKITKGTGTSSNPYILSE